LVTNRREINLLAREKSLESYYENPNMCEYCGKIIEAVITSKGGVDIYHTKKKRFCNSSCSAYFNKPVGRIQIHFPHKCENPECNNVTVNIHFCSRGCSGKNLKLLKIDRFLRGELNDDCVRDASIREFLIERQGGGCEICGNPPTWNSKDITFIVDHVDGNYENNYPENVRAICPNCNSQTDSFSGRNNFKVEHVKKRTKSNPNRK
jgi:hypothetical protein